MKSGETVLRSSRHVQEVLNEEFTDVATFGRKVDLVFKSGDTELTNFEFKPHGVSDSTLKVQHKKNIRLNRAIMEDLILSGVEKPSIMFGDFEGFSGCFFSLRPFEDVYVCDLMEFVSFPRNNYELAALLQDGGLFRTVITVLEHIKSLETQVMQKAAANDLQLKRQKLSRVYGSGESRQPPRLVKTFSRSVCLSP
ncbi:hypothetical protein EDD21DRAFT_380088 [Dissophora ornata]|nr:hypothetical protein EDD21DRAFT_380088 [Dissophora ornata]